MAAASCLLGSGNLGTNATSVGARAQIRPPPDADPGGPGERRARREPESLLDWTERRIRMRMECPEIGWGDFSVLRLNVPEVLAIRYDFHGISMLPLHNFSSRRQTVAVDIRWDNGGLLVDVFDENPSRSESGTHELTLGPFGHRWFRIGAPDNALNRAPF